jgi:hypothetical protein
MSSMWEDGYVNGEVEAIVQELNASYAAPFSCSLPRLPPPNAVERKDIDDGDAKDALPLPPAVVNDRGVSPASRGLSLQRQIADHRQWLEDRVQKLSLAQRRVDEVLDAVNQLKDLHHQITTINNEIRTDAQNLLTQRVRIRLILV